VEGALFFALTGQHERYQALALDGALMAGGYHAAGEATQRAVRDSMVGAGSWGWSARLVSIASAAP
jgi:hypothetical protein